MTQDPVDLGLLESLVGYQLRRVSMGFTPHFSRGSKNRIRPGLFGTLSIIAANPGISQAAVANTLGIKASNMVTLIEELLEMGFVRRVANSKDRRARSLTVTAAGKAQLKATMAHFLSLEQQMLARLTKNQRKTLHHLLSLIRVEITVDDRLIGTFSSHRP
jgi:DNA-binding MarR family transcriptional regulator